MSEPWKKELEKAKTSFNNLKPGAKAGIIGGIVCLALAGAGSNQGATTTNVDAAKLPVVSEEELNDALDKCTLLKASEYYKADSKMLETELFQKAETSCKTKKADYDYRLDEYVKETNDDWMRKSSSLIADQPLTYYLEESDGTQERAVAFAKPLQTINKQKAEEEAKKKAEAEAKKKAEEEAQKKAEAEAEAKRQAEAAAAAAAANSASPDTSNSTNTQQTQSTGITGYCKDGTPAYGDPSARGKANSCYGHGGWVR